MANLVATRTLVKSPPELWDELSDIEALARHLGEFGEIKISRIEPEREIAWEAERASGTVEIEASSWGTKVVLTAELPEVVPARPIQPEVVPARPIQPEVVPARPIRAETEIPEPAPHRPEKRTRAGFFARWLFPERRQRPQREPEPIEAVEQSREPPREATAPEPQPAPGPLDEERAREVLEDTLETLGSAHHRPFSRG